MEVDLSKLSKDNLGTSYIPDDICSKPGAGKPVALQVTGNGFKMGLEDLHDSYITFS